MKSLLVAVLLVVIAVAICILARASGDLPPQERPASTPTTASPALAESRGAAERSEFPEQLDRIVVQVSDGRGRLRAGIDVAFAWQVGGNPAPVLQHIGRTTGREALLEVAGVRNSVANARAHYAEMTGAGLTVECAGLEAAVAPFDVDDFPQDVVQLVLPPSGSLLAELVDDTGQVLGQEMSVSVEVLFPDGASAWVHTVRAAGSARVPAVALGRRLRAHVTSMGLRLGVRELDGPRTDGEEVVIRWQVPAHCPVLTGLVVTSDGRPAAECSLRADGRVPRSVEPDAMVATDATGRFRYAVDPGAAGQQLDSLLLDEFRLPGGLTGRRASARFAHVLRAGAQDLGNFTLLELPFLLACEVVDEAARPIGGALHVDLARKAEGRSAPLIEATHELPMAFRHPPARFEFRGHADAGQLVALAMHPEYLPSGAIPFERGARDLRIVLVKAGSLEAVFLSDPDSVPIVRLREDATPRNVSEGHREQLAGGFSCRWPGLRAGSYTLQVRLPLEREPMFVLEGLVVEAGKPCDDPRLAAIDLRGRTRRITVRVTRAGGEPLASGEVVQIGLLDLASTEQPVRVHGTQDGSATLVFSRPTISFVVGARGYRPKELREVSADLTVALEPGLLINARLTPVALPEGVLAYCFVRPSRRELHVNSYSTSAHRPGETVSIGPLEPGRHELGYVLAAAAVGRSARVVTRTIEVLDTTEAQLFEVTCTAPELEAALAQLGR